MEDIDIKTTGNSPKEPSISSQNKNILRSPNASYNQESTVYRASPAKITSQSPTVSPGPQLIPSVIQTSSPRELSYKSAKSPSRRLSPVILKSPQSLHTRPEQAIEIVDRLQNMETLDRLKEPSPINTYSPRELSNKNTKNPSPLGPKSLRTPNTSPGQAEEIIDKLVNLGPHGQNISEHVDELTEAIKYVSKELDSSQAPNVGNIDKIARMSKQLTNEANALRNSIKSLTKDIAQTKHELSKTKEDVNFPYHLFLVEIIVNKIHMKCECFDLDYKNLVITASFLGKQPIVLYDPSYGKLENFQKLNVGKSTLFAMTYDKICAIKEFEIILQLTKQPPCSSCVTNIGETRIDYTNEFITLREELCTKWTEERPKDDIQCTTAMPLSKNMYYLSCNDNEEHDPIGVIEVTVRMSFLGKEITTAFCSSPKPQTTPLLLKKDNGMTMYSCHKVEMDDQGKILLDEDVMTKERSYPRSESPTSLISSLISSRRSYEPPR
jgi:hypothetical protein